MTEFNLPLLRKAVEWAESEARKPQRESEWCQRYFATSGQALGRDCGTAYCIAGYVAEQAGLQVGVYHIDGDNEAKAAQDLLGIDDHDAWGDSWGRDGTGLFSSGNTIEDVREIATEIAEKYGEEL